MSSIIYNTKDKWWKRLVYIQLCPCSMCKFDLDRAKSIYVPTHTAATKQQGPGRAGFGPRAAVVSESLSIWFTATVSLPLSWNAAHSPLWSLGSKVTRAFPSHSSVTTAQGKQGPCINLSLSFFSLEHPHSCCVMYWGQKKRRLLWTIS